MSTTVAQEFKTPAQVAPSTLTAVAALVSPATLIGTWTNVDHATRNIVKIVIAAAGKGITVHAFGACTPTPCDWGAVAGLAYSSGVSSTTSVAFSVQYKFSFSQVILVGHLVGKQLLVESFTHFTDGSGRNDYYNTDTMTK